MREAQTLPLPLVSLGQIWSMGKSKLAGVLF